MKSTTVVLALSLVVLLSIYLVYRRKADHSPAAISDVYLGLRNQALHASRTSIGLQPPSDPSQPWGVLMDWGIDSGTATILAMSDGSASVYLSSGGGFLGGQAQEPINQAAKKAVAIAGEFQPDMRLTSTFPVAARGQVIFYVLTDSGVFTAEASDEDFRTNRNPLSKLANAMQEIVTQYRLQQTGH